MTVWTARIAFVFYAFALGTAVSHRAPSERLRRATWSLAYAALMVHVLIAFALVHGWSHEHAYEHTVRITADWTGWNSGAGIYANYALLVLWGGDVLWWWINPHRRRLRPRWMAALLHGFLFFMFLQAAVVFVPSPNRWFHLGVLLIAIVIGIRAGQFCRGEQLD